MEQMPFSARRQNQQTLELIRSDAEAKQRQVSRLGKSKRMGKMVERRIAYL